MVFTDASAEPITAGAKGRLSRPLRDGGHRPVSYVHCHSRVRLQPDQIDLGMLTIITRGLIAIPLEIETGARRHIASGHIMCSRIGMHSFAK